MMVENLEGLIVELELKIKGQGDHASFLISDITIKEGAFIYKLFNKRDSFPFSTITMLLIEDNIPKNIFYSAFQGEFSRIASFFMPQELYT